MDSTFAEMSSNWFGARRLGRDRDVVTDVRRCTAFLQAADETWDRGELIFRTPVADELVWQPFPQGRSRVYHGPFELSPGAPAGADVEQVTLSSRDEQAVLRVAQRDLPVVRDALLVSGS
jgi:hypothetical protein